MENLLKRLFKKDSKPFSIIDLNMNEYIEYKVTLANYEETLERMEMNNPSLRNL